MELVVTSVELRLFIEVHRIQMMTAWVTGGDDCAAARETRAWEAQYFLKKSG